MSIYKQKGRQTYMMDFVFMGHRVYESTGEQNRKRAQTVHDKRLNDLRDSAKGLKKEDRQYFFGAAANEWRNVAWRPKGKRKTPWSRSMESIVDSSLKRLLPVFGEERLLADISARDIWAYQEKRLAEPKPPSNRTVNMEVGVLRKILIHTGHWARLKDKVAMLDERTEVGRALTREQEALLLEECGRSASRALLPFVTLAIDTGARYDTIRTLQWERVNLEQGWMKIGKDKTKAGTGRMVPLNARALATLKFWAAQFPKRKPEHYVFPVERYGLHGKKGSFGGEVRPYESDPTKPVGTIQSAWESAKRRTQCHCPSCDGHLGEVPKGKSYACELCGAKLERLPVGLTQFRFHDLRHTAVTRMIVGGTPLPIIAKVVGWTLATVVELAERYGHPEMADLRKAVEGISTLQPVPCELPCASDFKVVAVQ